MGVGLAFCVGTTGLACSGPSVDLSGCRVASETLLRAIETRMDVDGALRHGRIVSVQEWVFVSAELHLDHHRPTEEGEILTWASEDLDRDPVELVAVDRRAREGSVWPAAPFDVRRDGAITSRGCTDSVRGTVDCGGGGPIQVDLGSRDCPEEEDGDE